MKGTKSKERSEIGIWNVECGNSKIQKGRGGGQKKTNKAAFLKSRFRGAREFIFRGLFRSHVKKIEGLALPFEIRTPAFDFRTEDKNAGGFPHCIKCRVVRDEMEPKLLWQDGAN